MTTVVQCGSCGFVGSDVDDACSSCGAPLALLSVVNGRVRLDERSDRVEVVVENSGRTGASFVLRSSDARHFPPWLIGFPDLDRAQHVPPGERVTLKFLVDGKALLGSQGRVIIPLVTSIIRYDEEAARARRRVLAIELATAGRPVAAPGMASYRFIPRELLEAGRTIARPLVVRNDGGHPVTLTHVALAPREIVLARGATAIAPEAILQLPALAKHEVIAPAASFSIDARLRLLPERLPATALGQFAMDVVFTFADGEKTRVAIDGVVGDGPRAKVPDSLTLHTGGRPLRGSVSVENPGAVPVRIAGVRVDVSADDSAWLRVLEPEALTLAPGARRDIAFLVDPEKRAPDTLDRPWAKAQLAFDHDGIGDAVARTTIVAELGRQKTLEAATLGVDFGTSNSSVSLFFGPTASLVPIAIDRDASRESMASLMFFVGERERDFLFGAAAENAAPLAWTNLVRNLKSVVAREPSTRWNFVDPRSGRLADTWTTQGLVDRFVVEVKRRAEDGLRALPTQQLAALGLVDTGVRFKHAIFSHPVGADESLLAALFGAAKSAGLAEGIHTVDQFVGERCLDEAAAAVIAYVHVVAGGGAACSDDERLLCFDIGGGTTDVAAIEVRGLDAFRRDPAGRVVDVVVRASGGDPRFGGTDIDRLLAVRMLDELAQRPALANLEIDEVKRALFFPSYEAYRRARGDAQQDAGRARAIYGRTTDVVRTAERLKLALGVEDGVVWVPNLDGWPLRDPAAPAPKGRIEIVVSRGDLAALLADPLARAAALVVPVVEDAGWSMDDVTTLLFTGQTSRLEGVRAAVKQALMAKRSKPVRVVEPGTLVGFDPKRCVAHGAAVWGDSKLQGGGWLRVDRRSKTALAASLQTRRGPLLVDVPGLVAGASLPARAHLELTEAQRSVSLYRAGSVAWTFEFATPARVIEIVVETEHRAAAIADGMRVEGRRA